MNRGHQVWSKQEDANDVLTGLMLMTTNRQFGSTLMSHMNTATRANKHLQPILAKLTESSSRWPRLLRTLTSAAGKFPTAEARAGIHGAIAVLTDKTLEAVNYSYDLAAGSFTVALEQALEDMRGEGALPLSESITFLADYLLHPIYAVVSTTQKQQDTTGWLSPTTGVPTAALGAPYTDSTPVPRTVQLTNCASRPPRSLHRVRRGP